MLSRWLQRGSIGQILAPDPAIKDDGKAEENEFKGGLWNVIAPDPNFNSPDKGSDSSDTLVNNNVQNHNSSSSIIVTPTKQSSSIGVLPSSDDVCEKKVEKLVLSAAKDLASCVASPPIIWEDHKKFFNYCASTTALSEKQLKKVHKMLKKDPSLANCRASKMGFLIPDGFTPLHAAAFVGNYEVALILIDFCASDNGTVAGKNDKNDSDNAGQEGVGEETKKEYFVSLDSRDVQGRTALHIASEQGHVKLVKLLKAKMSERNPDGVLPVGENAPIDLTGRTPLGCAATSRETMACQYRDELRIELFSPGDKSVFGKKTPALDRTGGRDGIIKRSTDGMDLLYGFAEMPGHRIEMEDAICHKFPIELENVSNNNVSEVGFFGVFDGHGDGGISSNYVADHIVQCLTATNEWNKYNGETHYLSQALMKACCDIDVDLKAMLHSGSSVRNGGSTGVMALITPVEIIIANVGDSRCILVQKESEKDKDEATNESKLIEEDDNSSSEVYDESALGVDPQSRLAEDSKQVQTKALTNDHKPNLSEEKIRIEKAGLEVVEETFPSGEKEGEMISIWKIQKSSREKIAVSRAFGDFDYKTNEDLKMDEQAIISVPDITIHQRNASNDLFLVLACDGVFDVMSNDEVGEFVAKRSNELSKGKDVLSPEMLPEVGDDLLKHCLELGSSDNMSVLIVALPSIKSTIDSAPRKLEFADI